MQGLMELQWKGTWEMGTELEWKLHLEHKEQLQEILQDVQLQALMAAPLRAVSMRSVYYDTANGALAARRWTLRCRTEGDQAVITVKTPAQGHARGEWQCQTDNMEAAIACLVADGAPAELRQLVQPGSLQVCCGAVFTRLVCDLVLPDGTRAELAGDCGEFLAGMRRQPFCELELEWKQGDARKVWALCQKIMKTYSLQEEPRSKFARALALAGK